MPIDSPTLAIAAFVPVFLLLLYKPVLRLLTPQGIPGIPAYPDPTPILGDLGRVGREVEKRNGFGPFIDQVAQDLGPIAQLRMSFLRTMVVVTDYASADHLLTKQHSFLERSQMTGDMFKSILPTAQISILTNDMWKHHRRIIGTAMTSKYLSLTTPRANEAIGHLIDLWRAKQATAEGRAWRADEDLESATMDAICGIAFGSNWGILKSFRQQVEQSKPESGPVGEAIFHAVPPPMQKSTLYLFNNLPYRSPLPTVSAFFQSFSPTWKHHRKQLSDFLDGKLADARTRAQDMGAETAIENADNTLDLMVARQLKGDDWMPNEEIKDELYQYLVAGTETSGTTLSWWVKYMTNHPEIQVKLRQHVLEKLPDIRDRQPTFEEMSAINLPYLEAVVWEALRLGRIVSLLVRDVVEDVVVLGKVIPKGIIIVFPTVTGWEDRSNPVYGAQAAPSISTSFAKDETIKQSEDLNGVRTDGALRKVGFWAAGSGKDFMPERWLDRKGKFDPNAGPNSLPFSLGQRACFGKNLALLEMRLFMCQLNQAFFFAPLGKNQNSFDIFETITVHPRQCLVKSLSWDSNEARAAVGA